MGILIGIIFIGWSFYLLVKGVKMLNKDEDGND